MKEIEQTRPMTAKVWLLARLVAGVVRLLGATVRLSVEREQEVDALAREHGGAILVSWHGRTLLPVYHCRGRGYYALISMSRDGDFLSEVFRLFGMKVIRGSTGRRGVMATRETLAALAGGGVVILTPDGPRGPTRVAQPGAAYFAQRSGKPLVPAGVAAYPRKCLRSWDRYMIPLPFSRAHWVYGEPLFVGPDDDLEEASRRLSAAINALERRAEAEAGVPAAETAAAEPTEPTAAA